MLFALLHIRGQTACMWCLIMGGYTVFICVHNLVQPRINLHPHTEARDRHPTKGRKALKALPATYQIQQQMNATPQAQAL